MPPLRLALTPKGQAIRHAALWAMPTAETGPHVARALQVEPARFVPSWTPPATRAPDSFEEIDDDDPYDDDALPAPPPMSIYGHNSLVRKVEQAEAKVGQRRGRKPGSKNKPKVTPAEPGKVTLTPRVIDPIAKVPASTARYMEREGIKTATAAMAQAVSDIATAATRAIGGTSAIENAQKAMADLKVAGHNVSPTAEAERARALAAKIKRWTTTRR